MSKEDKELICEGCGSKDDVYNHRVYWTTYGRWFSSGWVKVMGSLPLCRKCAMNDWMTCDLCGALIEGDNYGVEYLPEGYEGNYLCPECAEKEGLKL